MYAYVNYVTEEDDCDNYPRSSQNTPRTEDHQTDPPTEALDQEIVELKYENAESNQAEAGETNEPQATMERPHQVKAPEYLSDYYRTTNVDYACAAIPIIPETYEQSISSGDATYWKAAMDNEISMLAENDMWEMRRSHHYLQIALKQKASGCSL